MKQYVLDLTGDGVRTQNIGAGVTLDLMALGQAIRTGWVSSTDGLLAMDLNQDGVINSGAELFGSATTLANGQKAEDGYAALNELDSNQDGFIDSQDKAFADLRVWADVNSDGATGQGELKTLAQLNISQLSLVTDSQASLDNGNVVGLNSSYQTTDGVSHAAADVWFQVDLRANVTLLAQAMAEYSESTCTSASTFGSNGLPGATDLAKAQWPQLAAIDLTKPPQQEVPLSSGILTLPK